jgi:hypothetical protein
MRPCGDDPHRETFAIEHDLRGRRLQTITRRQPG